MDESDDEPVSLPCSNPEAKIGLPTLVQLHLVNTGLEKNPDPRDDFYRQYSVTPERKTPEEERTPPPPVYSPGTKIKKRKARAARVAEGLKQFYAGRVMLRKEAAEQDGVLQEDPDYWSSKIERWQDEGTRLVREMGKRKGLELKGEAKEGYALAMLASPLQSPSPPPSDSSQSKFAQKLKGSTAISDRLPEINTRPSQPPAGPAQGSSQPTPEPNSDCLPSPTKGHKRTRAEVEGNEEEDVDQSSRTKRQRKEITTAQQKGPKRKNVPSKAALTQRTLPWKLRSRDVRSCRDLGTRMNTKDRGHQGEKKAY
ncbi:hypothetical protein IMSHALPRED_010853 [Imshaugia aleurites]|uniref:Uncharacterized protein n=1 Tax=Imshaugia aleurites TaxID=172621 RepID=A0A8H3G8S7_9LECA|nr:hypothetical protein IMSHALPRED_010853 [Imshaugia aleurites]